MIKKMAIFLAAVLCVMVATSVLRFTSAASSFAQNANSSSTTNRDIMMPKTHSSRRQTFRRTRGSFLRMLTRPRTQYHRRKSR